MFVGRGSVSLPNSGRPMPPSPTVKDPKRMRKESGQRYDDPAAVKPVGGGGGGMTKIIGEGENDPYLMAAATANNFNQDSNMSSGTYVRVDMCVRGRRLD